MAKKSSKLKSLVVGAAMTAVVAGSSVWAIKNHKLIFPLPAYELGRIIDGDTFVTKEGQHIRLLFADAPDEGYCGYTEAKDQLKELLEDKDIYLKVDYHDNSRFYAEVFTLDGDVSAAMIKSGWARYGGSYKDRQEFYGQASAYAREHKLGIFGYCSSTEPKNSDCNIKGNISIAPLRGEKYYFFPGCSNYSNTVVDQDRGDRWFCTEKEAQTAGFKKSSNCPN